MKNISIVIGAAVVAIILVVAQRNSLLHKGASAGKTGMMSIGLLAGADANAPDDSGATALMSAAEGGHADAVNKLIGKKADVNRKHRDNGKTALMLAASRGHGEVVDALLAAGAALDIRDNNERTAYSYAFENNKFDVAHKVRYIAENRVDLPDRSKQTGGSRTGPHTAKQIRKVPAPLTAPR